MVKNTLKKAFFFSIILNEKDGSELNVKLGSSQNFRLDNVMDYLLTRNFSSTLVNGFVQLASR